MCAIPIFAAALVVFAAPAVAQTAAEATIGVQYQEGDYGLGERVETLTVNNVLRIRSDRVQIFASLPYERVEAPGNVTGGGGPLGLPIIIDPTRPTARQTREGIGDLRIGAAYTLPRAAGIDVTLSGQAKLPTASVRRGLGTGEVDFSVGAEASRPIGSVTPFAGLSYTVVGDPEVYALRNSLAARGGVALQLSPSMRGNVSYGYARSVSPLVADEQEFSTGLDLGLSRHLSLGLYGSAGLSDGSPDLGAGAQISFRLF